jgi:hypothetical protein
MFSITRKPNQEEWILPEEVFVSVLMKRMKRHMRASNLVFVTEEILRPYEEFKTLLEGGARKKKFPCPDGVDEISHLVLCDTFHSGVRKKNCRVGRKTLQDLTKAGYAVTETDKPVATVLPSAIPWTITSKPIFDRALRTPEVVQEIAPVGPFAKLVTLSEEQKEDMQDDMYKRFGAGVRVDFL